MAAQKGSRVGCCEGGRRSSSNTYPSPDPVQAAALCVSKLFAALQGSCARKLALLYPPLARPAPEAKTELQGKGDC